MQVQSLLLDIALQQEGAHTKKQFVKIGARQRCTLGEEVWASP